MRFDDSQARMRSMVGEHFRFVARALRRRGVPRSELDDEIQRTFIVAASRLETTPPAHERRFLLGVTVNVAAHARRKLGRRREVLTDTVPDRVERLATPEHLVERKRLRELIDRILDEMDEPLRAVLMLHALEEMNLTEIAARLAIPRGTAASRLRRARAQFRDYLAAINLAWDWREAASALERALLRAGASTIASAPLRAHTLAALGLDPVPLSLA